MKIQDDSTINLLKYAKKVGKLIIFAYPRASTPGCTKQAKGFGENSEKIAKMGGSILGLSADSVNAQSNFKNKYDLPFDLLSDKNYQLIELLGCKKQPKGVIRSHFIFVDGILKDKKVGISPLDSVEGALKQVKDL